MSNFIRSFRHVPVLLFRLNAGKSIKLRAYSAEKSRSFDVFAEAGMVTPKALDPSTYEAPNGASMRPLGTFQTKLVQNFKGKDVLVYAIPEGTPLPEDLILVHEHTDHYSLQPTVEMPLAELNMRITEFLNAYASVYTRDQWLEEFKDDVSQSSLAGPSSSSGSTDPQWKFSATHQRYYYKNENGDRIWAPDTSEQQTGRSSKSNKRR